LWASSPSGVNRRRILVQFKHEESRLVASNCDIFVQAFLKSEGSKAGEP